MAVFSLEVQIECGKIRLARMYWILRSWTKQHLARTLLDVRAILLSSQNKAAEIEIGAAIHRHVVAAVQSSEVYANT